MVFVLICQYVTNEGSTFVFRTSKDAPKYKLVTVDVSLDRGREGGESAKFWSTFLEENESKVLVRALPISGYGALMKLILMSCVNIAHSDLLPYAQGQASFTLHKRGGEDYAGITQPEGCISDS